MIRPLLRDLQNGDEVLQDCKVKSIWATDFLSVGIPEVKLTAQLFEAPLNYGIGSRSYRSLSLRYANLLYMGIPGKFLGSSILNGGIYLTLDYGVSFTPILINPGNTYAFAKSGLNIVAIKRISTGTYNDFLVSIDDGATFLPYSSGAITVPSFQSGNDFIAFNNIFYYIQNLSLVKIQVDPIVNVTFNVVTQQRQLFKTDTYLYASNQANGGLFYSDGKTNPVLCTFDATGQNSTHFAVIKHNDITYSFGSSGVFKSIDGINFTVIGLPPLTNGNLLFTPSSIYTAIHYDGRYNRIELLKYLASSGGRLDLYVFNFTSAGDLSPIYKANRLFSETDLRTGILNGVYFSDHLIDTDRTMFWGIRNDGQDFTSIENTVQDYPILSRPTNSETLNIIQARQYAIPLCNSALSSEIGSGSINGIISASQDGNLRYYYNAITTELAGPNQLIRLRFDGSLAIATPIFSNSDFNIFWDIVTRQFRIQFINAAWFASNTYNYWYSVTWSAGIQTVSSNVNPFIAGTLYYLATASVISSGLYNNTQASPMRVECYFSSSNNATNVPTFYLTSFISSLGIVSFQLEKH